MKRKETWLRFHFKSMSIVFYSFEIIENSGIHLIMSEFLGSCYEIKVQMYMSLPNGQSLSGNESRVTNDYLSLFELFKLAKASKHFIIVTNHAAFNYCRCLKMLHFTIE